MIYQLKRFIRMNSQIQNLKTNLIMLRFLDSVLENTNWRNKNVFDRCSSFWILTQWYDKKFWLSLTGLTKCDSYYKVRRNKWYIDFSCFFIKSVITQAWTNFEPDTHRARSGMQNLRGTLDFSGMHILLFKKEKKH